MKNNKTAAAERQKAAEQIKKVLEETLGFRDITARTIEGEECLVAYLKERPAVLAYIPDHTGPVTPSDEEVAMQLGAIVPGGPADYVWATSTGNIGDGFFYSWLPEKECQVTSIPAASDMVSVGTTGHQAVSVGAPMRFKELHADFDALHEKIYAAREPIDGSNDLTAQLCKLIFLKMHYEHHPDFRPVPGGPLFEELFRSDYILNNKSTAVDLIKKAFSVAKDLPEYSAKDDQGRDFRIFDRDDFIKFQQPTTYAAVADMLNRHRLSSPEDTGLEDDILGRAFDVMLRGKFEGKGGMGVYLTPQQVRDAMVQMAFYDILKEDPGLLTRRNPQTNKLIFRMCDPCCGSAGFIVTAMREMRKHLNKLVGMSNAQRQELLKEVLSECFLGADNAPGIVLLARINMALHGDPRARLFRVENSLTADVFLPESYDLILTNPPFKKGGITISENSDILSYFQSDIVQGKPQMAGGGLALASKPDGKGIWKPVKSVDPAALFIDRCLQLLKPGGRLLIVVPDGILCNSGDRYVREYIMGRKDEETGQFTGGKAVVKAVVSLPPITFRLSGAGAKTSYLYLQKKRPGDVQGPVFMAVADQVGFDVKQNKEVITGQNDLVSIVESYKQGPSAKTS